MNESAPSLQVRRSLTILETLALVLVATVLLALLYPGHNIQHEAARRSQANNDLQQIVTSVEAYRAEYGRYPTANASTPITDAPFPTDIFFGDEAALIYRAPNRELFDLLRALPEGADADHRQNPRRIAFLDGRMASDARRPMAGFQPDPGGDPATAGCWFDPWGHQYNVAIDTNGDGVIDFHRQYSDFSGPNAPPIAVGAFSLGQDGQPGTKGDRHYANGAKRSDDILSWQPLPRGLPTPAPEKRATD